MWIAHCHCMRTPSRMALTSSADTYATAMLPELRALPAVGPASGRWWYLEGGPSAWGFGRRDPTKSKVLIRFICTRHALLRVIGNSLFPVSVPVRTPQQLAS